MLQMTNNWALRDEILLATQKWPWLAFYCLLGCLSGWAVSFIWPTPHRATTELYVGLNVYRSSEDENASEYAGIELVNANDYKNWQMASLNSLTKMDEVIVETLIQLRKIDPYWNEVDQTDLARSLHVYWRNAGKWRLVAENENPQYATQAVTIWQDVVLERVHSAVLESQRAMILVFHLKSIASTLSHINTSIETIKESRSNLQHWLNDLIAKDPTGPLGSTDRRRLWQIIPTNSPDAMWTPLLNSFPAPNASVDEYSTWIKEVNLSFGETIKSMEGQKNSLLAQEAEIKDQFSEVSRQSRGLSANLDVEKLSGGRTEQTIVRPTGMLILIGCLLGLVVWVVKWLTQICMQKKA